MRHDACWLACLQKNRRILVEASKKQPGAEPRRAKSHWDFVLEEMAWMANDFAQVRNNCRFFVDYVFLVSFMGFLGLLGVSWGFFGFFWGFLGL